MRNVRTAVEHLKKTGEVTVTSYQKFSVISIKNYDLYQAGDKQPTSNRQAADKQPTTIKEVKKSRSQEHVLNVAAAGNLSLADAAKYVSDSVKGFADESKTAAYYTDLMAKGATLANTDVKSLGEALSGGAATAASYG